MSTVAGAVYRLWWRRFLILLAITAVIVVIAVLTSPQVGAIIEALEPPGLPAPVSVSEQVSLDQGWAPQDADRFHHEAQGTHTLPIPLSWFLALEAPLNSTFAVPFSKRERFADNRYLLRFGFISSAKSKNNEYGLPIGFAYSPFQSIKGLSRKETAVGLTCAACHTGQLVFKEKRYVIEGGPAVTDLGQLTFALRAALGQTALSAKLPFFDGRFRRFAKAVLGTEYNDLTRVQLSRELDGILGALVDQPAGIDVTEGFSRLDALNRIGNQVFALDPERYGNYVNINAPVTYPHIWTSSWFDWVQYDGSIMQPLVRNAGEAMGVSAELNLTASPKEGRFANPSII
ncbi:di-heme-cytochrome C peroxidase [Bradyrhizobium sp. UFLA05-153]